METGRAPRSPGTSSSFFFLRWLRTVSGATFPRGQPDILIREHASEIGGGYDTRKAFRRADVSDAADVIVPIEPPPLTRL